MKQYADSMMGALAPIMLELGIPASTIQLDQIRLYHELLMKANRRINFTRIVEPVDVAVKHFADSFMLLNKKLVPLHCRLIDVGSGAGFPGLPLAIVRPDIQVLLLDSLRKRTDFLEGVIDQLQLANVSVFWARAEDAAHCKDLRESFDVAVARAVSSLPVLCEYCLPFVKKGGCFLAMKGPQGMEEVSLSERAMQLLGGSLESVFEFSLPVLFEPRLLVSVRKTTMSGRLYPRKAGQPEKNPL